MNDNYSISDSEKDNLSSIVDDLKLLQKEGKLDKETDAYQLIRMYNWFTYLSGLSTPYIALEKLNSGIGVWRWHSAMASLITFGYDDIMEEPFIGIRRDVYNEYFKDSKLVAIGMPKDNSCLVLRFFLDASFMLVIRIPVVSEKLKIFKNFVSSYNEKTYKGEAFWKIYLRPFEGDDIVAGRATETILIDPENNDGDDKKFLAIFGVNYK